MEGWLDSLPGSIDFADGRDTQISTGVLFGLALTLALGRTCIKLLRFRRIFIDDIFFFLSIVFLVAGNVLGWVELPSMETVTFAEAGIGFTSFSDFIQRLVSYVKLSAAAGAMLNACNYCVKLSFMFFFRGLLRRLRGLLIWWWCVLMYIILTATACILSTAAVCPASGEAILGKDTRDLDPAVMTANNSSSK